MLHLLYHPARPLLLPRYVLSVGFLREVLAADAQNTQDTDTGQGVTGSWISSQADATGVATRGSAAPWPSWMWPLMVPGAPEATAATSCAASERLLICAPFGSLVH